MNRLSRRNLLLSLPACTLLPPFQPRPAHRPTPRGWHRCLAHARERVTQELRVFKTLIAPLVVRSHYRDEGGRWQFAPDYQRLRSYQLVTDALSNALLVREIPADIEVQPAMQEARDYVSEIDSCVALNGREPGLAKRCRVDRLPNGRQTLVWNCALKFATTSQDHLSHAAHEIVSVVRPAAKTSGSPIRTLASLTHEQRLAAFSCLSTFGYGYLIGPLFEIAPFTPLEIFSIGLRQRCRWYDMGGAGSTDIVWHAAGRFQLFDSSKVDFLCRSVVAAAFCSAISTLANNHFLRILDLARRAEHFAGDWMPFIPGEILGALHQKIAILNRLRTGDTRVLDVN